MATVSVIMPCYNAAPFLTTSVGSVLRQTFTDWELIAVDDGSTDDTAARLAAFEDPRIHILRQPNRGSAAARNAGLTAARGKYVAFLDADDSWHPEFLATMVAALEDAGTPAIAYCGWQNVGLAGGRGEPFIPPDYENDSKLITLLQGCRWAVHAAMLPTAAARAAGGFDEQQKAVEDYDFWLRTATRLPLVRVARVLAYYHHHGQGQKSQNRPRTAYFRLRALQRFFRANPEHARQLGARRVRRLLWQPVLASAYEAYWQRDLPAARTLFRLVMRHGYGSLRDWIYMLPSLLPLSLHAALLRVRDASSGGQK